MRRNQIVEYFELEHVVKLYYHRVNYRFSLIVRDAHIADDLSQEVFARLCNRLRDGCNIENAWAFISGIIQNVWLEHLRSNSKTSLQFARIDEIGELIDPQSSESVDLVQNDDLRKRMRQCLLDLDTEEQEIIVGLYYFEMTGEELSKWLNRPRKTLLYRHERAMQKLRTIAIRHGLTL